MSDISQMLRAAAARLESAAESADGPWLLGGTDWQGNRFIGAYHGECTQGACEPQYGHEPGCGYELAMTVPDVFAQYLQFVDPEIGKVVAAWLQAEAVGLDVHGGCRTEAVQVAQMILRRGEQS